MHRQADEKKTPRVRGRGPQQRVCTDAFQITILFWLGGGDHRESHSSTPIIPSDDRALGGAPELGSDVQLHDREQALQSGGGTAEQRKKEKKV